MTRHPGQQRNFLVNPSTESLLQLAAQKIRVCALISRTPILWKAICCRGAFWRRHRATLLLPGRRVRALVPSTQRIGGTSFCELPCHLVLRKATMEKTLWRTQADSLTRCAEIGESPKPSTYQATALKTAPDTLSPPARGNENNDPYRRRGSHQKEMHPLPAV